LSKKIKTIFDDEKGRAGAPMNKRGDCYDNAAMESWNHSFKVEAIHGEKFSTRDLAKKHVF
jgi:transposase InsO family protein